MAWHMKNPAEFKRLIRERSEGRELGPLKYADFARMAGVQEPFVANIINGTKGCSRTVALGLVDRLGHPHMRLDELFEER